MNEAETVKALCHEYGLALSDEQLALLARYAELLLEWNKKVNLISRKDEANVWISHILHSLSPAIFLKLPREAKVLDIGTGGGLPGIPLKILFPEWEALLMDSTKKKIDAVADMVRQLGLSRIQGVWGRSEELCRLPENKHKMDFVFARAVAPLYDLVKWSKPFLKIVSPETPAADSTDVKIPSLITLKGGDLTEELESVRHLREIKNIRIIDIVFGEHTFPELEEKKIIVVEF